MNKENWPCDRRDAHGPHPISEDEMPAWSDGIKFPDCPGVKAHPNTTIGGRHDGQAAMYGQIDVGPLTGGREPGTIICETNADTL